MPLGEWRPVTNRPVRPFPVVHRRGSVVSAEPDSLRQRSRDGPSSYESPPPRESTSVARPSVRAAPTPLPSPCRSPESRPPAVVRVSGLRQRESVGRPARPLASMSAIHSPREHVRRELRPGSPDHPDRMPRFASRSRLSDSPRCPTNQSPGRPCRADSSRCRPHGRTCTSPTCADGRHW